MNDQDDDKATKESLLGLVATDLIPREFAAGMPNTAPTNIGNDLTWREDHPVIVPGFNPVMCANVYPALAIADAINGTSPLALTRDSTLGFLGKDFNLGTSFFHDSSVGFPQSYNFPSAVWAEPTGQINQTVMSPYLGHDTRTPLTTDYLSQRLGANPECPTMRTLMDPSVVHAPPYLNETLAGGISNLGLQALQDFNGAAYRIFTNDFFGLTDSNAGILNLGQRQDFRANCTTAMMPPPPRLVYENDIERVKDEILKNVLKKVKTQPEEQDAEEEFEESTGLILKFLDQRCPGELGKQLQDFLKGARRVLENRYETEDSVGHAAESMTRLFDYLPDALYDVEEAKKRVPKKRRERLKNAQIACWLEIDPTTSYFEQEIPIGKYRDFIDKFSQLRHDPHRRRLGTSNMKILISEAEWYLVRLLKKI